MTNAVQRLEVHLLDESDWIGIDTLCRLCQLDVRAVVELADLGWVAPRGYAPAEWQLPATSLPRLRIVGRLMRDLGVNVEGAALAVELLEEQRRLQERVRLLEQLFYAG
jgi:chaperone modulatory protein CbpM